MEAHKSLPHSDELERSVLSACLHFECDRDIVMQQLSVEDFYSPRNAELFCVMRAQHKSGCPCDELLIRSACASKPNALELLDGLHVALHPDISALCQRLRALHAARRFTRTAFEVAASGIEASPDPNAFLEAASRKFSLTLQNRDSEVKSVAIADLCSGFFETIDKDPAEKAVGCLGTGLRQLDGGIGGLERSRLYVVAGRPGMGKSALATQLVEAVAIGGGRCAVFSLEMPPAELAQRMACSIARLDSRVLKNRRLNDLEAKRLSNATNKLAALPIVFPDAATLTVEQIARHARQEKQRGGLALIVVDYLQLVSSNRGGGRDSNREQEVSEISRGLKLLARELEVPVIACCQLSRKCEERADKRPMLSDLRESGAIEQDADVVLFLYREDVYTQNAAKGLTEIIVGKNRGGETGFVKVRFDREFTRFADLISI